MAERKLRLACIASGSGTDFESIAKAWKNGWLPEIKEAVLISTKEGAGCLGKAAALDIRSKVVLPQRKALPVKELSAALYSLGGTDLIFLVGCIVRVPECLVTRGIPYKIPMYNIHPADPRKHGGQGMYGLTVHLHVLNEIKDLVERGMAKATGRFFTTPTVHEAVAEYDQGKELLRAQVEIPSDLVQFWVAGTYQCSDEDMAKKLQQIVLPFEWMMLPCAVRLAAKKILDQQKN
ncbi:MAG TPA: hypothetical protein ENN28_03990 [Candidatus Uhrbacteria bacterium]|nr:hypothetical protein [Candidatus Uhrbacteria bacterium]